MAKRNYAKRETKEYNFLTEVFQWMCVWLFTMPYVFLFYKVKVEGRENIPKNQSFLVAPTHSGYLDPILSSFATKRPIAYMAKKELYDVKWLCPIIVALGTFAVNRAKLEIATIRTAQAIMKTNHWLLSMFPQGTRDNVGEITKINPGFAYLANMAKAQILPVSITGSEKFSKVPFGGKIVIKIGKPFDPSKNMADTMEKWCEEIVKLGDYQVAQCTKDKIEQIRAKKDKHESADSEG
ncbi:MAG: 1-acyl-sn-glycerol-3-phosphate acyltransferase [Candidatus Gastranaerophilales bacterium]|nr:1-acyl-sn-glycerol-3-phosphate acyltransferase [Candidatus Gastranaerophilales bacterium]